MIVSLNFEKLVLVWTDLKENVETEIWITPCTDNDVMA
jgi:hypothetical protein